jgi:hypothetical protein
MKRGPNKIIRKTLSPSGLLSTIRESFKTHINVKTRASRNISVSDCLMSGIAMFSLKAQSLLAFDKKRNEKLVEHNLKKLYSVEHVPSDTYMREQLDAIEPSKIRSAFLDVFHALQRSKLLDEYKFFDGYILAIDGTEVFESNKVHCSNCCEKEHHDGTKTYHHQILTAAIVHPDKRQVIPLCPEPILKQDGSDKNDCEIRALERFLPDLKCEHPRLKLTLTLDALFANAPQINKITDNGYHYIIAVKPGKNVKLFAAVAKATLNTVDFTIGKNKYTFCYVNNIPLHDAPDAPKVNFIECTCVEYKHKIAHKHFFTYITDYVITDGNAFSIMKGGRVKWKIENETFNTLKNQGYQFEHNFGHGKKNLHTIFSMLMLLAFLTDQIQEATNSFFQASLQFAGSRREFWERIKNTFYMVFLDTWEMVFYIISVQFEGFKPPCENTS